MLQSVTTLHSNWMHVKLPNKILLLRGRENIRRNISIRDKFISV